MASQQAKDPQLTYNHSHCQGLVKLVEEIVRFEHASYIDKPIHLVAYDYFGGCLPLAVASCNPAIDLVIHISNPPTSFARSQLQPLFLLLGTMPNGLHSAVPYLSAIMGDLVKMAAVNIESMLPPEQRFERLSGLLPYLSVRRACQLIFFPFSPFVFY
ncbi:phytyl ester synthase 1, chloroplastic-like [Castanea sativa]|uniref:phytyl ester synthase 1, chloroplastic-like n=1 Tax=Castanea sativa TaxID=21020 RepID=UPI003F65098C